jgi:hypothetical protein
VKKHSELGKVLIEYLLSASSEGQSSKERKLWLAVIEQSFLDAFESSDVNLIGQGASSKDLKRKNALARRAAKIRQEAITFLIEPEREDDRDLDTVCAWAGVDAKVIRLAVAREIMSRRAAGQPDFGPVGVKYETVCV